MEHLFVSIFFVGAMIIVFAVFALIVAGRIIGGVAGGLGRMLGLIPSQPRLMARPPMRATAGPPPINPARWPNGYIQCRVPGCRHANPAKARFCRHCGHAFPVATPVIPQREYPRM